MLEDEDDILGMLSKPVEVVRASTGKKVCIPSHFLLIFRIAHNCLQ
jgi:hypothetical protein